MRPKHVVENMLNNFISKSYDRRFIYLYRRTVHFVVYLINTPTNAHIWTFNNLKFTLKYLKRSYMFRSYDHPQGAYTVSC